MEKYKKGKIISENKVAKVYEGINTFTEKEVIIKEYSNSEYFDIYKNEKNILNKHRIIFFPYLIDIVESENIKILIMEKIKGKTIREIGKNKLERKEIIEIIKKLMNAVLCFYKKTNNRYLLGDISIDNVILTDTCEICIIDLQSVTDNTKKSKLATYNYSHPEIFRNKSVNRINSDIYNIGIIWIYLLTGEKNLKNINKIEMKQQKIIRDCVIQKRKLHLEKIYNRLSLINLKCIPNKMCKKIAIYKNEELAVELYYSAKKQGINVCIKNLLKRSLFIRNIFKDKFGEDYYENEINKKYDLTIEITADMNIELYDKIIISLRALSIEVDSLFEMFELENLPKDSFILCFYKYDKKYMLPEKIIENEIGQEYDYCILRKNKVRNISYETNYMKYLENKKIKDISKLIKLVVKGV